MENNIQIIGNEDLIIYYNLNKQFSNVKKVIITKDVILNSFENSEMKNLVVDLKSSDPSEYFNILKDNKEVFENNLSSEMYNEVQDKLNKLSNNYMDVQLENYNFMNSISNSKFNVTIRCEQFSITNYYIEKGALLTNIKTLLRDYLNFSGNIFRLPRLDIFQIEIYETEEIHKNIILKKENDSLILAAAYGFNRNSPIDYSIGQELYVSKGNDFNFFKNKQEFAIVREYNKLVEKEIKPQEKVLDNQELVTINNKTSSIDDAIIEAYINPKQELKIVNVSLIENPLNKYSDNGFIISKSSKNYDKISIVSIRDNLEEEGMNPKYLLIKNEGDAKEFISNLKVANKIDGIIITKNLYNKIFDRIAKAKNIDILFIDKNLKKSIEETIDWENVDIANSKKEETDDNPFNQIIQEQNKEEKQKDELLERLKNIDLNSAPQTEQQNNPQVEATVNSIIGSQNSSFNKSSNNNQNNKNQGDNMYSNQKKSAFDLLMASAMNQKEQNDRMKEQNQQQAAMARQQAQAQQQMGQQAQQTMHQQNMQQVPNQGMQQNYNQQMAPQPQQQVSQNQYQQPQMHTQQQDNVQQTHTQQQAHHTMNIPTQETQVSETVKIKQEVEEEIDVTQYESVLATEIIGNPGINNATSYFVDMNTISYVEPHNKIYFLTLSPDEMSNPNLNYVLPIGLNNENIKGCSLLIKHVQDFFLINEKQDVEYIVDLTDVHQMLKKNFLNEMISKVGIISIMCETKDLDLIGDNINKIKSIRIKDVESDEKMNVVKQQILGFEKRYLMSKGN